MSFPLAALRPERAAASPLHERVVVLVASEGAEGVVNALGALPGVTARPHGTRLFAEGLPRLAGDFIVGRAGGAGGGLSALVDEQGMLAALRQLADEPLGALAEATGSHWVVEWSPDHAEHGDFIRSVYPDALVLDDDDVKAISNEAAARLPELIRRLDLPVTGADIDRAVAAVHAPVADQTPPPATSTGPVEAESPLRDGLLMVLGAPRSGTTWLANMLQAHPLVAGAGEAESWLFVALQDVWANHDRPGPHGLAHWLHQAALTAAVRRFCDTIFAAARDRERPEAQWFVEKTPQHAASLDRIGRVYPDAAFVHLVRDGRDVAHSMFEADIGEVDDPAAGAALWARLVRAARHDGPRLARFREVRYEELFADPWGGVADLLRWLGLPADDNVERAVVARAGRRVSVHGTSGPVGPAKWQTGLSREQLRGVYAVAGDLLVDLGYVSDGELPRLVRWRRRGRRLLGRESSRGLRV